MRLSWLVERHAALASKAVKASGIRFVYSSWLVERHAALASFMARAMALSEVLRSWLVERHAALVSVKGRWSRSAAGSWLVERHAALASSGSRTTCGVRLGVVARGAPRGSCILSGERERIRDVVARGAPRGSCIASSPQLPTSTFAVVVARGAPRGSCIPSSAVVARGAPRGSCILPIRAGRRKRLSVVARGAPRGSCILPAVENDHGARAQSWLVERHAALASGLAGGVSFCMVISCIARRSPSSRGSWSATRLLHQARICVESDDEAVLVVARGAPRGSCIHGSPRCPTPNLRGGRGSWSATRLLHPRRKHAAEKAAAIRSWLVERHAALASPKGSAWASRSRWRRGSWSATRLLHHASRRARGGDDRRVVARGAPRGSCIRKDAEPCSRARSVLRCRGSWSATRLLHPV